MVANNQEALRPLTLCKGARNQYRSPLAHPRTTLPPEANSTQLSLLSYAARDSTSAGSTFGEWLKLMSFPACPATRLHDEQRRYG